MAALLSRFGFAAWASRVGVRGQRSLVIALVTAVLPLVAGPARAAGDGAAPAGALFRQGREDAARGDYEHACPRFAESLRLAPAVGTMLNLADCEERRGRLADALEHFQHGLESLAPSDDRLAFVRERIAKLVPRVPRVRIRASGSPTSVELDGVVLGEAARGVAIPVNPGERTIVVRAKGRADRSYSVLVAEGATVDVDVAPGAPAPSLAGASPDRPAAPSQHSSRALAWTSLAVGGAGLALSAVTGIAALHLAGTVRDHCPNHTCTDPNDLDTAKSGKTYVAISTIGLAVGVAGVGVAGVLFLTEDRGRRTSTVVAPMAGPTIAGISLSQTFR